MKKRRSPQDATLDRSIGRRVAERRMVLGWTQVELAAILGISQQQIQKYEDGPSGLSASRLWELASVFRVGPEYFYESAVTDGFALARDFAEFQPRDNETR